MANTSAKFLVFCLLNKTNSLLVIWLIIIMKLMEEKEEAALEYIIFHRISPKEME